MDASKQRRAMERELAAICADDKPEAPQRFAPWGGRGIDKGAKPSSPLILWCGTSSSTTFANVVCNRAAISW
ncbi:hypothetical protein HR45_00645 [Shewanella mangrovi]|uniref:Uncharacterized protein n=1 Tax=Shewanella mangrovi TaxID=1515746 RepID=A0A094JG95_9GAMM|nr:hypothetical protein HR45_00645 [Shewanella mangrovi]